jgi:cytochrome c oxidase cbb3-type subunit 3
MRRLLLAIALLGGTGEVLAQGDPGHGKDLYEIYCTQCHGVQGNGLGINATSLTVQPRDHTDVGEMSARTDEDLFKAISQGGKAVNKSVLMPAWGRNLSEAEIRDLIAHLRDLCCQK